LLDSISRGIQTRQDREALHAEMYSKMLLRFFSKKVRQNRTQTEQAGASPPPQSRGTPLPQKGTLVSHQKILKPEQSISTLDSSEDNVLLAPIWGKEGFLQQRLRDGNLSENCR